MHRNLRIAFVGPSGVGKTAARDIAVERLREMGYAVTYADIAWPLHEIQRSMDRILRIRRGDGEQDDELFSLIIRKFWTNVMANFVSEFDYQVGNVTSLPHAVVNGDCRDNSYETLKSLGFSFIRVVAPHEQRMHRLMARDVGLDLTGEKAKRLIERLRVDDTKHIPTDPNLLINNDGSMGDLRRSVLSVLSKL